MGDGCVRQPVGLGPVTGDQRGVGDHHSHCGAREGEHPAGRRCDRPPDASRGTDCVEGADLVTRFAPQQTGGHGEDGEREQHARRRGAVADDSEPTRRVAKLDCEPGGSGELPGACEVGGRKRLLEVEEPAGSHRLETCGVETSIGDQGAGARGEVRDVDACDPIVRDGSRMKTGWVMFPVM